MPDLTVDASPGSARSSTPPGGNPPAPTSPTPPAPAATAAPTAPAPYRFGNDVDEWARGKTPEEVLAVTRTLMGAVGQPFRQSAPVVPAAVPPATPIQLDAEGYVTGAQAQALQRDAVAQLQPHYRTAIDLAASGNLSMVRQQHSKDFSKYGPEIMAKLALVPKESWTVDTLETVVKLVQVDHLDEIAGERAQQLVNTMEPTMRSIGGAGSAPVPATQPDGFSAQWEKLPPEWRAKAEKAGITEAVVEEFCRGNEGMTAQDFFKQFGDRAIGEAVV